MEKIIPYIYQCKYHIVWCPKYRYRILKGQVAEFVEQTLKMLYEWRNIEILETNIDRRGPYTYDTFYPSPIINIRSDGNAKRQNSNKTLQELSYSQKETLLGEPLLELGILRKFYKLGREQN